MWWWWLSQSRHVKFHITLSKTGAACQNEAAVMPWSVSPVPVIVSTPSRCCLFSPVYLSLCFLSLCASSSCMFSQVNQRVFPVLLLLFSFSSPPGFDPCLFLDSIPAYLTILPALSATLYLLNSDLVLTFLPVHNHSLAYPFGLLNIVRLQPTTSCVCIWVSPHALIAAACQQTDTRTSLSINMDGC